jgi:hypothetical protein
MDFKEAEKPAPVTTNDSTTDDLVNNERAQRKREKRERKEARKLKKEAKAAMAAAETGKLKEKQNTPPIDATPAATPVKNGRYGPRGPYKKREKGPDGTPVSAAKKRKRETEVPVDSPAVTGKGLADADNWLGPNFKKNMEDNKKSLARLASIFDQRINENAKLTESPRNKPGRPVGSGKKTVAKTIETEIPKASDTTKKAIKSDEIKPKAKRQKLEKTPVAFNEENVSKVSKTPIPVPSVASALPTEPKSTPVPLPQKSLGALTRSVSESPIKKNKIDLRESEVLVSETPLSQMSRTPATTPRVQAIPFSLRPAVTTSKETSKAPGTLESSPEIPLMIYTKSPEARKRIVGSQGSVNPLTNSQVDSLTTANLMRFKEPLRDTPKPRPRGRRSVSEAPSTSSSSSSTTSRTIRDMLMRPNKPYTRPSNEISPFNNKKKHIERHEEANLATFSSTFTASRRTVNFTDEAAYLDEYDEWLSDSEAAGTLPCLKQASGCTAKSEQLLQLQRSDDTSAFKVIITNETETENTASDIARVKAASTFLRYSILTRIPIPLGSIEGTFKLYCPKYTTTPCRQVRVRSTHFEHHLHRRSKSHVGSLYSASLYSTSLHAVPDPSVRSPTPRFVPHHHAQDSC